MGLNWGEVHNLTSWLRDGFKLGEVHNLTSWLRFIEVVSWWLLGLGHLHLNSFFLSSSDTQIKRTISLRLTRGG